MPMHKRESLIYTVMMCFTMVLWMSIYNVTLHMGTLNMETIKEAWIGFPIAYVFAMLCDWFVVSGPAKGFAFRFLVSPDSSTMKKLGSGQINSVYLAKDEQRGTERVLKEGQKDMAMDNEAATSVYSRIKIKRATEKKYTMNTAYRDVAVSMIGLN